MAESQNDDLADALARLAGGDVAPSEHTPPPPLRPAPMPAAPPPKPARPAVARPPSARPAAAAAPKPKAVASAPPAKPQRPTAPALKNAPPPPPPAPTPPAPAAAAARKLRPAAPTLRQATLAPTDAEADGGLSTGLSNVAQNSEVIDDDDAMLAPAPEASVFLPRKKPATSAEARAAIQKKKNLEYRRTLIPILLTSGTMMLIFGILKFLTGPDSMLQNLPGWIPITLLCCGLVVLALAAVNIMSVKQQLAAEVKNAGQ